MYKTHRSLSLSIYQLVMGTSSVLILVLFVNIPASVLRSHIVSYWRYLSNLHVRLTPGLPHLGSMDERLVTPRLKKPRILIPSGSIGIAGRQTGIYPIDSPGGWQLMGRTLIKLYSV